jgi:hypothetical protein
MLSLDKCENCQTNYKLNDVFCNYCGNKLNEGKISVKLIEEEYDRPFVEKMEQYLNTGWTLMGYSVIKRNHTNCYSAILKKRD